MSEALRQILVDPVFYVLALLVGWFVRLILERIMHSAVDERFSRRIEEHRHQLQLIAEESRYALQHRLAGVSLYLQKQHAAAAEIYAAVRIAHGAVSALFGSQRSLSIEDCNEEDLREVLANNEVMKGKQTELIELWRQDRIAGIDAIRRHFYELTVPRADARLLEARNTMYLNEIYFSDATLLAFDAFVGECLKWINLRYWPPQPGVKAERLSREDLDKSLEAVQEALRTELADPVPLRRRAESVGSATRALPLA